MARFYNFSSWFFHFPSFWKMLWYSILLKYYMIFHPSRRFFNFPSLWNFFYFPSFTKILWFSILLEDFTIFHPNGRFYHFPSIWKILLFSILPEHILIFHPSGIFYDFPSFWNTQFHFDTHWMFGQTHWSGNSMSYHLFLNVVFFSKQEMELLMQDMLMYHIIWSVTC